MDDPRLRESEPDGLGNERRLRRLLDEDARPDQERRAELENDVLMVLEHDRFRCSAVRLLIHRHLDGFAVADTIAGIVTDSKAPGEPKQVEGSALFQIYQAFASADETAAMRAAFADGIGWGDAKRKLYERIDAEVAPLRERYEALIAHPQRIEQQLRDGAQRLRAQYAIPVLARLREAVGLRGLSRVPTVVDAPAKKSASAVFKQYRETDGRFYFKLHDGEGRLLLQSVGFGSPRDAGQLIGSIKQAPARLRDEAESGLHLGEVLVGKLAEDIVLDDVLDALTTLVTESGVA